MRQRYNKRIKASLAFIMTLTMLFGMLTLTVNASEAIPNQAVAPGTPNTEPGHGTIYFSDYDLEFTVTEGGNNLVFSVTHAGVTVTVDRAGNGTFTQTVDVFGFVASIRVQGNSIYSVTLLSVPYSCGCKCDPGCSNACDGSCLRTGGCECDCDCKDGSFDCGFECENGICEKDPNCKHNLNNECICECICDETPDPGGGGGGSDPGGGGGGNDPGGGGGDNPIGGGGGNDPGGGGGNNPGGGGGNNPGGGGGGNNPGGDGTGGGGGDGTGGTGGGTGGDGTGGDGTGGTGEDGTDGDTATGGTDALTGGGAAAAADPAATGLTEDPINIDDPQQPLAQGPAGTNRDSGFFANTNDEDDDLITIPDSDIPLAPFSNGKTWAVMNLILSAAGAIMSLMIGFHILIMKKKRDGALLEDTMQTKRLVLAFVTPFLAISGLVLFILTQDMRLPMRMVDWYTPAHAAIFYGGAQSYIYACRISKDDDSDDQQPFLGAQA